MSIKKNLWLRLGVTMELTEEEFCAVRDEGQAGEAIIRNKVESGDFLLDGETYAPENSYRARSGEWVFDRDIEFEFCPKNAGKKDDDKDGWYGIVRWTVEDVIAAAAEQGISLTAETAAAWWRNNENAFKNIMVGHGNQVLSDMDYNMAERGRSGYGQ